MKLLEFCFYLWPDSSQDCGAKFSSLFGTSKGIAGGVLHARQLRNPRCVHRKKGIWALESRFHDLEGTGHDCTGRASDSKERNWKLVACQSFLVRQLSPQPRFDSEEEKTSQIFVSRCKKKRIKRRQQARSIDHVNFASTSSFDRIAQSHSFLFSSKQPH